MTERVPAEPNPVSINGFYIHFRKTRFSASETLWVPRFVTRNEPSKCWRIKITHQTGCFEDNVYDRHRSRAESLEACWPILRSVCEANKPNAIADRSPHNPGITPRIDTGVRGVTVHLSRQKGKTAIGVTVVQMVNPAGTPKPVSRRIHTITLKDYMDGALGLQARLDEALKTAVAMRRYYNYYRSIKGHPSEAIEKADIPDEFLRMSPPKRVSLDEVVEVLAPVES